MKTPFFLLAIILCLYAFSISAYAENEKISEGDIHEDHAFP